MIGFLEAIVQGILLVGQYIVWAVVTVWNLFMISIGVTLSALFAVLPSMPTTGTISTEYLEYANWFFPVGAVATMGATMVTLFLVWLAVRYALRMVRAA